MMYQEEAGREIGFVDFDKMFDPTKVITSSNMLDVNNNYEMTGIFSEIFFGKINDNDTYSCDCGQLQGYSHSGITCMSCKTVVKDNDYFKKNAWIDLKDVYVIQPIFYNFLKVIMPIKDIIAKDNSKKTTIDYKNIGMEAFKDNFDDIVNYYASKSKKPKAMKYRDILLKYKDRVFVNKIFVFSIGLRPALLLGNQLIFDGVNKFFNLIISNKQTIEKSLENDKNAKSFLYNNLIVEIQNYYLEIFKFVVTKISGKDGILRNHLLGYRVNFSSRSVIIPGTFKHKIDEISIPYITAMEFFKFNIINYLVKLNYDYAAAYRRVEDAMINFDEDIYGVVEELITKNDIRCLLNRNPTISIGSIIQLKITKVKRDMIDYTMTISNNLLELLAGDYDGDVLNLILLIDNQFRDFTNLFSPINFITNKNDGEFNSDISVDRDCIVSLRNFLLN